MNSNTQHTPGPWEVTESDATSAKVGSITDGGIAFLHDPIADELGRTEELHANARLIAAAPDLLAALQAMAAEAGEIAGQMQKDPSFGIINGERAAIQGVFAHLAGQARAALAKAGV